jgi:hypothetical protein
LNPGIVVLDKDREKGRLMKLSTFIIVDFIRGLASKIERENEDLR